MMGDGFGLHRTGAYDGQYVALIYRDLKALFTSRYDTSLVWVGQIPQCWPRCTATMGGMFAMFTYSCGIVGELDE